jgi:hypothetical protein
MSGNDVSLSECYVCKAQDFLPIVCKDCNHEYCDHHYKTHQCSHNKSTLPSSASSASTASTTKVKDLFDNVTKRFDNDDDVNARNHYNVKTCVDNKNDINTKTNNVLEKLEKVSGKEASLANTTRNIILRKNAKQGGSNINDEDKIYIVVRFNDIDQCYYFKSTSTVSEALNYLCNHYPDIFFKQPVRPNDSCLRAYQMNDDDNDDSTSQVLLDRKLLISSLKSMSRIKCEVITAQDALNDQLIEEERSNQHKKMKIEEKQQVIHQEFTKGMFVIYRKNDIQECVEIIGVHKEDYPNLYYTIKFDNGNEKQTVPENLELFQDNKKLVQADDAIDDNDSFSVNVLHGKNNYIVKVKDMMMISDLKNLMFNLTGVPSRNQKIIYKGKVLSNDILCSNANITPNCKIQLMGSK